MYLAALIFRLQELCQSLHSLSCNSNRLSAWELIVTMTRKMQLHFHWARLTSWNPSALWKLSRNHNKFAHAPTPTPASTSTLAALGRMHKPRGETNAHTHTPTHTVKANLQHWCVKQSERERGEWKGERANTHEWKQEFLCVPTTAEKEKERDRESWWLRERGRRYTSTTSYSKMCSTVIYPTEQYDFCILLEAVCKLITHEIVTSITSMFIIGSEPNFQKSLGRW